MLKWKPSTLLLLTALVFGLSVWYAANLDVADFVTDDGGITLRYAERIAGGKGFNYNDGQAVNGVSNPLYTLVLAGLLALGLSPKVAIFAIAIPALAGTTSLLFYAFARYWSLFAALVSIPAYWSAAFVLNYQFDALEPMFSVLFAALLFLALNGQNRIFQGVALGLLVANKLDGALAPIAFTIVWLVFERRIPWRQAVSALAAAAPVFLVLLIAFGSILPNSMLTKLHDQTPGGFGRLWMINSLRQSLPQIFYPALLSFLLPVSSAGRLARSVVQLWLVLVLTVYASIDLGAPYPWYTSLPAFLVVILSVITAHSVYHALSNVAEPAAGTSSAPAVGLLVRALGVGTLVLYAIYEPLPAIVRRLRDEKRPDRVSQVYASEIARQACGVWLRKYTDGTELFSVPFGLPSFEYQGPVYDGSLLNSRSDPSAHVRAAYSILGPFPPPKDPPSVDGSRKIVGLFSYGADSHAYALYARDESQIVRAGHTHFGHHFTPVSAYDCVLNRVAVAGKDYQIDKGVLFQSVPSTLMFQFESPEGAPFSFTPQLLQNKPGANAGVAWSVNLDGEDVAHGQLLSGETAETYRIRVVHPSPAGRHKVTFQVGPLDRVAAPLRFSWTNLTQPREAPLSSTDFHAICKPWALRIDAVEGAR